MYLGNTPNNQAYAPQVAYFSGNASTTIFTLPTPVATTAQLLVFVANVPQKPGSAFTVSGSTLTFSSAPPVGTNNIWVEYTSLITQTISPVAGSVSQASLGVINYYQNPQTLSQSITIPSGQSAMMTGPVSLASGYTITLGSGARLVVL